MLRGKVLMVASTWRHIRDFHLPYLFEFRNLGWVTHVACANAPDVHECCDRCIRVPFVKRASSSNNLRSMLQLRSLIASQRYDLIITHTTLASFVTRLASKGLAHCSRVVTVCHGFLFDEITPPRRSNAFLGAERVCAPYTDLLLTMNAWDFDIATSQGLSKRVGMIPGMGVDFGRLDSSTDEDGKVLRRELGIDPSAFVILCAAELSTRKSRDVLIRALPYLPPEVVLVLCGDGDRRVAYAELASRLGLGERVLFPGYVRDIGRWFRMADAAASASRYEGLPFNVMEAMHVGLPIVASGIKGHVDLISPGETGLLYPYGDAKACAACVKRLSENVQLRRNLGIKAKEDVRAYSLDAVLPQVMDQYLSLVDASWTDGGAFA